MHVAQEIGSYAGLAAVVGLAVLSALYFSQARDVKRLREWAGRAPERAPEPQAQGVVSRPAIPKPVQPGAPATPKPAAGTAAAASAAAAAAGTQVKPAQASATGAATPAAQQAAGATAGADKEDEAKDDSADSAKPEGETVTPAAASAAGAAPAKEGEDAKESEDAKEEETGATQASPANGSGATPTPTPAPAASTAAAQGAATPAGQDTQPPTVPPRAPVRRAPSGRPGGAPPPARPPKSTILPSYDEVQNPAPWYRRLWASPLYLVLAIVGLLVVLGAAAFGITQLGSSDSGSGSANTSQPTPSPNGGGSDKGTPAKPAAIVPSKVTVAVLNGTSVPGLAAQIGDKLTAAKFKLGNVSNSNDGGARAESVVYYANGAKKEAELVSRKLRISQREPIDAQTQQLAGDARVVVIAGADQTQ